MASLWEVLNAILEFQLWFQEMMEKKRNKYETFSKIEPMGPEMTGFAVPLFIHSLVDECTCRDQGLNPQSW